MPVEVMPWDRGLLACAAAKGDPRTDPRTLPAALVDLAVKGHLMITAEAVDTFRLKVLPRAGQDQGPGAGVGPDELALRNLVGTASATSPDGVTLAELRRDPVFVVSWHHLQGQVRTTAGRRDARRPPGGRSGDTGDTHDLAFGVRIALGVASLAAGAIGWPQPLFMAGAFLGLAASVLVPDARPQVVRGRSLASDLEEVDRSVLTIAASGTSRIDRSAYERALPIGILMGRNLDLWAVLADGAYPDGCPWFALGPRLAVARRGSASATGAPGPPSTPDPQRSAAGGAPGTTGTATAGGADGDQESSGDGAGDGSGDGSEIVQVPGVGALLRAFCLQAAAEVALADVTGAAGAGAAGAGAAGAGAGGRGGGPTGS